MGTSIGWAGAWNHHRMRQAGKYAQMHYAYVTAKDWYQRRWREAQISLLAALRRGDLTLEEAEQRLFPTDNRVTIWERMFKPHPLAAELRRDPAWLYGQQDLVRALRAGETTVQAAAVNLGMVTQDEGFRLPQPVRPSETQFPDLPGEPI